MANETNSIRDHLARGNKDADSAQLAYTNDLYVMVTHDALGAPLTTYMGVIRDPLGRPRYFEVPSRMVRCVDTTEKCVGGRKRALHLIPEGTLPPDGEFPTTASPSASTTPPGASKSTPVSSSGTKLKPWWWSIAVPGL